MRNNQVERKMTKLPLCSIPNGDRPRQARHQGGNSGPWDNVNDDIKGRIPYESDRPKNIPKIAFVIDSGNR